MNRKMIKEINAICGDGKPLEIKYFEIFLNGLLDRVKSRSVINDVLQKLLPFRSIILKNYHKNPTTRPRL